MILTAPIDGSGSSRTIKLKHGGQTGVTDAVPPHAR